MIKQEKGVGDGNVTSIPKISSPVYFFTPSPPPPSPFPIPTFNV